MEDLIAPFHYKYLQLIITYNGKARLSEDEE